ncbi:hypothetical protein CFK37_03795 [Virgibacillus phasianinus]|uniref:Ribbon-helix-helix protein CopG domain-containing protein n=1 Tax=Virgibacillus phasianinus TaxID=2017483 RepID=A0A220U079_9BACI|nr:hypothetical protein [Virgibacillus phasianinus]ASK61356.1 hypothetical protein CFK37_03795 [Virgibacillus phasianinus]
MDVKIRDLHAGAMQVLLEEAKKQKVSRNELLKRHIEDLATFNGMKNAERDLERAVGRAGDALEITYRRLDQLEEQSLKMYLLLTIVLDVDPEEVDEYLEGMFHIKRKGDHTDG